MRKFNMKKISEAGSLMVEAIAMLGLISMVTPVVYKKSAERMNELQDINAASQMRTLSSALDAYLSDNYATLSEREYNDYIPAENLAPYLPAGMVDEHGNLYGVLGDDYKFYYTITNDDTKKVLTGYVGADNKENIDAKRASRIATMIGGNGGYVDGGTVYGAQGVWQVDSDDIEMGSLTDNSIVVASSSGISAEGHIDTEEFLHRNYQDNAKLNTMYTDLYMYHPTAGGAAYSNIEGVGRLLIGAQEGREGTLSANESAIGTHSLYVGDGNGGGSAYVKGALEAVESKFKVSDTGLAYNPGGETETKGSFTINTTGLTYNDPGNTGNLFNIQSGKMSYTSQDNDFSILSSGTLEYQGEDSVFKVNVSSNTLSFGAKPQGNRTATPVLDITSSFGDEGRSFRVDSKQIVIADDATNKGRVQIGGYTGYESKFIVNGKQGANKVYSIDNNNQDIYLDLYERLGDNNQTVYRANTNNSFDMQRVVDADISGARSFLTGKTVATEIEAGYIKTNDMDIANFRAGRENLLTSGDNANHPWNFEAGKDTIKMGLYADDKGSNSNKNNEYRAGMRVIDGESGESDNQWCVVAEGNVQECFDDDEKNMAENFASNYSDTHYVEARVVRSGSTNRQAFVELSAKNTGSNAQSNTFKLSGGSSSIDHICEAKCEMEGGQDCAIRCREATSGGLEADIGFGGISMTTAGGGISNTINGTSSEHGSMENTVTGGGDYTVNVNRDTPTTGANYTVNADGIVSIKQKSQDDVISSITLNEKGTETYDDEGALTNTDDATLVSIAAKQQKKKAMGTSTEGDVYYNLDNEKAVIEMTNAGEIKINTLNLKVDNNPKTDGQYFFPNNYQGEHEYSQTASQENPWVYIRQGAIGLRYDSQGEKASPHGALSGNGFVMADRFVVQRGDEGSGYIRNPSKASSFGDNDNNLKKYDTYMVDPAYTSVMHDIKLTSRGGARLSDILPDFINKGIYVVDNSYGEGINPGKYNIDGETTKLDDTQSTNYASAYLGAVPAPQCPPGYAKVITLNPASWRMAEIGTLVKDITDTNSKDRTYVQPLNNIYKEDGTTAENYLDVITDDDGIPVDGAEPAAKLSALEKLAAAIDRIYQGGTWLKTAIKMKMGSTGVTGASNQLVTDEQNYNFAGWDTYMGFIYPADEWKNVSRYFNENVEDSTYKDESTFGGATVYWNLFPVMKYSMEGYATVYCYFDRNGLLNSNTSIFDSSLVDTTYNQFSSRRSVEPGASKENDAYTNRLFNPKLKYNDQW